MRKPIICVTNLLLDDQNRVLLGQRVGDERWEFPGGKVEDETVLEAARRECWEEVGIDLWGDPKFIGYINTMRPSGKRYVVLGFLWKEGQWSGEAIRKEPDKHYCWAWTNEVENLPLSHPSEYFLRNITLV